MARAGKKKKKEIKDWAERKIRKVRKKLNNQSLTVTIARWPRPSEPLCKAS